MDIDERRAMHDAWSKVGGSSTARAVGSTKQMRASAEAAAMRNELLEAPKIDGGDWRNTFAEQAAVMRKRAAQRSKCHRRRLEKSFR